MTAMLNMKLEIELRQAILDAIAKAVKAGMEADQVKAILDQIGEAVETYGTED